MLRICADVLQFLGMRITIQVTIPALDRLMEYLEGQQQKQIDDLVARLKAGNANLTDVVDQSKGE